MAALGDVNFILYQVGWILYLHLVFLLRPRRRDLGRQTFWCESVEKRNVSGGGCIPTHGMQGSGILMSSLGTVTLMATAMDKYHALNKQHEIPSEGPQGDGLDSESQSKFSFLLNRCHLILDLAAPELVCFPYFPPSHWSPYS